MARLVAFSATAFQHCGRARFVSTYNKISASRLRRRTSASVTPSESPDQLDRHTEFMDFQEAEERRRERAKREAAQKARKDRSLLEAEQRQAELNRRRKMAQVKCTGDRLEPGDNPDSHFARVADVLGLESTGSFVYPGDYAESDAALRGTLDTRPGSRAIRLFMLSLDQDLAADLRAKDGLVADDENQLKVQVFAVPDVTPVVFRRFSACDMEQLKNALRRAAMQSETVDTLITEFEGQVFEPGDDLSRWFDSRNRDFRRLRG